MNIIDHYIKHRINKNHYDESPCHHLISNVLFSTQMTTEVTTTNTPDISSSTEESTENAETSTPDLPSSTERTTQSVKTSTPDFSFSTDIATEKSSTSTPEIPLFDCHQRDSRNVLWDGRPWQNVKKSCDEGFTIGNFTEGRLFAKADDVQIHMNSAISY